jgi:NADH-quinone oxidoreductase subunit F
MAKTYEQLRERALQEWSALQNGEKPRISIGMGTCGMAAGAAAVEEAIRQKLTELGIEATITHVGCIGLCCIEPVVSIGKKGGPDIYYGNLTAEAAAGIIEDYLIKNNPRPEAAVGKVGEASIDGIPELWDSPMLKGQVRVVLRNSGIIDPENIDHYIARGGYSGAVRALKMTPDAVIEEVKTSGLRGRGGAGFPTATKWELCRKAPGSPKYVICNADEGDPGAFMNRALMESDPHQVLEGMIIGAYAIGASQGYVYCRAEKPLAIKRLEVALQQAIDFGIIGDNIFGSGFNFHLEIRKGAGAFVCGEETALMASIEGGRGMPRSRPPFPAQAGLWNQPTNINNVESWANISAIFLNSGKWYASFGTDKSKGTKTFALAGKIKRTGLIEVPLGIPIKDIIFGIGGGILDDKKFKAVQAGGPSGGCIPATHMDLPVDYENLARAGAIVGSGGMIVVDEATCMVDLARFFLTFVQSESCGKCVPCRLGTKQMLEILTRICDGDGKPEDIEMLEVLSSQVKTGSLCGLGQTAPNPVLTTLRYFRDEYEAHIKEKRCPAGACMAMTAFDISPDKCQGCGLCARSCPVEAISGGKRMIHAIDQQKCIKCGTCEDVCPKRFSAVTRVPAHTLIGWVRQPTPVTAGAKG